MGACCSTEEDKENINIDHKSGQNKKPSKGKKGGKASFISRPLKNPFSLFLTFNFSLLYPN
jgi:hypothetical protein